MRTGEEPSDYDKAVVAHLAEQGYAAVENGRPALLIPFFEAAEHTRLREVLAAVRAEAGETLFVPFIEGFADAVAREIPAFIREDERTYLRYQAYPQYAVLYRLADRGLLRYPTEEEAKRLCTVVWCRE